MNKAELVTKMAEKSELTKKEAEAALNAFMQSVEEALVEGDKVYPFLLMSYLLDFYQNLLHYLL